MAKCNQLWTKTAFANVPPMMSQDGKGDEAIAYVRIFSMLNGWEWFITEFDPTTGEAFALVNGHEMELGSVALCQGVDPVNNEVWDGETMQEQNDNFKGRYSMPPFERDLHWTPKTLGAIRAEKAVTV